jgi:hypothetical protein
LVCISGIPHRGTEAALYLEKASRLEEAGFELPVPFMIAAESNWVRCS